MFNQNCERLTAENENFNLKPEVVNQRSSVSGFRKLAFRLGLAASVTLGGISTLETTDIGVLEPTSVASASNSGYPHADMPCLTPGVNYGKTSGTGKWCAGYSWGELATGNNYSSRGFVYRNCTDWAAFRAQQLTGVLVPYGRAMGHGGFWDNNAPTYGFTVDMKPEAGDLAVWDPAGGLDEFGHVAVVESVNANGTVNISEYNGAHDGNYRTRSGVTANAYVDLNGTGKGINGQTPGGPEQPWGRLVLVNSVGAGYAKDEIIPGGWNRLTVNGDATSISASDTHVALVNGSGDAYAADIDPAKLKSGAPGLVPLHVPKEPNVAGGTKKVVTDKDGNMIAINNCGAAYGWRNIDGNRQWRRMTSCGDAKDVEIGSGRMALINSCSGAYISDVGYSWTPVLNCGDAKAIAIGETGRIMAINGTDTAYIYNPGAGSWVNKTAPGDARKIAIGKDRIMVITSGGAAWGADVGQNNYAAMTQLTANGDATAISVGAHDRMGLVNGAGAAYVSDNIVQGGQWSRQSGDGDARTFVVG